MLLQGQSREQSNDAEYQPGEQPPVAPSAVPIGIGQVFAPKTGKQVDYTTPRALEVSEIPGVVKQFADGAKNALEAGAAFPCQNAVKRGWELTVLSVDMILGIGTLIWLSADLKIDCLPQESRTCAHFCKLTLKPQRQCTRSLMLIRALFLQGLMVLKSMVQTVSKPCIL